MTSQKKAKTKQKQLILHSEEYYFAGWITHIQNSAPKMFFCTHPNMKESYSESKT